MTERRDADEAGAAVAESTGRLTAAEVADLLGLLAKCVRAYQLYQSNNPVYQKFITALTTRLKDLLQRTPELRLTIEETGISWAGERVAESAGRDSLPYLFYKDGIRYLTLLPGFEDEVEDFLGLVQRARLADAYGDDLVTLLWEKDFLAFQYGYIDVLAEGLVLPQAEGHELVIGREPIVSEVQESAASAEAAPGAATAAAMPTDLIASINRGDFDETLYFLEDAELHAVQQELDREWHRDLRIDVLNALFDRLEEPVQKRQAEILGILRQLLPTFLSRGELNAASYVLQQLDALLERGDVFDDERRSAVDGLLDELSRPDILGQLIQALQEGGIQPEVKELELFLGHLRPAALPVLIRAAETAATPVLLERLPPAIERLAAEQVQHLLALLDSADVHVAVGAARLAGRLRVTAAAPRLARLLERPESELRRAAVDALVALHSSTAVDALQLALEDADRDVRIAAVRGLGAMRYQPARTRLESILRTRAIRDADLTEKLAFFEAYGALAGPDGVALLDRFLNGRSLLRRHEPAEIRACAALALGRLGSPAARTALERARGEADPVVRSAVARALRQEAAAQ